MVLLQKAALSDERPIFFSIEGNSIKNFPLDEKFLMGRLIFKLPNHLFDKGWALIQKDGEFEMVLVDSTFKMNEAINLVGILKNIEIELI